MSEAEDFVISDVQLIQRCLLHPLQYRDARELLIRYGKLVMQAISWVYTRYGVKDSQEIEDVFQDVFALLGVQYLTPEQREQYA